MHNQVTVLTNSLLNGIIYLLCIYIELSFFHVGAKTVIHSGHKAVIGNSRVEEHICRQAVLEMDHNSQQPANLVNKKMEVILMFLTCVQLVHVHVLVHSCTIINMYLIKILKHIIAHTCAQLTLSVLDSFRDFVVHVRHNTRTYTCT